MFPGLTEDQLEAAIQAMLFVSDEVVSTITLADMLLVQPADVELACMDLKLRLEEENSGIELQEAAGGWRLLTKPVFHNLLENYVLSWDTRKLSQAMLETLAVVAYTQPVTRQGVAAVRGVNSDSSINSLVDKGLLREAGQADAPGNPALYATTRSFLEKMGLQSLGELPDLQQFAPDEETKRFIAARLSSTRTDAVLPLYGDEADGQAFEEPQPSQQLQDSMNQILSNALAQNAGVVEKIDFDELSFDD